VKSLGGYYNYVWYRASYSSDHGGPNTLYFTNAADRLHVFLNQKNVERVWGLGHGATRDPLTVNLAAGKNDLLFLCDNMGRNAEGDGYDMKGIWGDVYVGAPEISLRGATLESASAPPREQSWRFKTYRKWQGDSTAPRFFRVRATVPLSEEEGALLEFRWIPQYTWIYANGKFVNEYSGDVGLAGGNNFGKFVLDSYLHGKELLIEATFFGEPSRDLLKRMHLFSYRKSNALGDWKFKAWENPRSTGGTEVWTRVVAV
jgi:hypothetical protein